MESKYKNGSLGYLNEKAKRNGFINWTEYHRYLIKKKEERLERLAFEKEKKIEEIIEKTLNIDLNLSLNKDNIRKKLKNSTSSKKFAKLKDLINSDI